MHRAGVATAGRNRHEDSGDHGCCGGSAPPSVVSVTAPSGALRSFLVEAYLPAADRPHVATSARRLRRAAADLRAAGAAITFDSGLVLIDDELTFYLFHSATLATVERALASAGIRFDRIAEASRLDLRRGRRGSDLAEPTAIILPAAATRR